MRPRGWFSSPAILEGGSKIRWPLGRLYYGAKVGNVSGANGANRLRRNCSQVDVGLNVKSLSWRGWKVDSLRADKKCANRRNGRQCNNGER